MITMQAQVSVDGEGGIHELNIEVSLDDVGFSIGQGESLEEMDVVRVQSETQARDLITAIRAMCAANGWDVSDDY